MEGIPLLGDEAEETFREVTKPIAKIECSMVKGEDQGLGSQRALKTTQSEIQLYHFLIL